MKKAYVLAAVIAAGLIATTATTMTEAQEQKWAVIEKIYDGQYWIPFTDGMSVDNEMPKFRGASGGIESVQITLNGEQVGTNKISDTGKIAKAQKWPLQDGTYDMIVRDCGPMVEKNNVGACTQHGADLSDYTVLFNATIQIGSEPAPTESESGAMETMKLEMAELKATIAELEATIADMLERMNSVNAPTITPPPDTPIIEVPESVPGQYYIRLMDSTNSTYSIGDQIHFEGKGALCDTPTYVETLGANYSTYGGGGIAFVVNGVSMHNMGGFDCVDGAPRISLENMKQGYANYGDQYWGSHLEGNITDFRGYFTVYEEMHPGEHYITMIVYMESQIADGHYPSFHTNRFTLVPPPPPIEYSEADKEQVHIRLINSTGLSYGAGDLLHYEGTILQCQRSIYGSDDLTGTIQIEVVYADGDEDGVASGHCYKDRAEWYPEEDEYVITGNQTHFSGYVAIDELDPDYNTRQPLYLKLYLEMSGVEDMLVRNSTTFTIE